MFEMRLIMALNITTLWKIDEVAFAVTADVHRLFWNMSIRSMVDEKYDFERDYIIS